MQTDRVNVVFDFLAVTISQSREVSCSCAWSNSAVRHMTLKLTRDLDCQRCSLSSFRDTQAENNEPHSVRDRKLIKQSMPDQIASTDANA